MKKHIILLLVGVAAYASVRIASGPLGLDPGLAGAAVLGIALLVLAVKVVQGFLQGAGLIREKKQEEDRPTSPRPDQQSPEE